MIAYAWDYCVFCPNDTGSRCTLNHRVVHGEDRVVSNVERHRYGGSATTAVTFKHFAYGTPQLGSGVYCMVTLNSSSFGCAKMR